MNESGHVLIANKIVLPPVKRASKYLRRKSALCSPDIYENVLHASNSTPDTALIGKKAGEPVRSDPVLLPCMSSDPQLRINQLEQNLRFLQEQHHSMLSSLHQEIESLRVRNRDLQFQLIFGNPGSCVIHSSSDSSPDDSRPKIVLSPKEINTRPLQVEMLDKEISELKVALNEANKKNASLTELLEQQKKLLEDSKKEVDCDHIEKLEEADLLIKRINRENEEQRKEINHLKSQLSKSSNSNRYSGGRRGGNHGGDYQRFPPLQSPNFWGHGSQNLRSSPEYHNGRNPMDQEIAGHQAPSLPHLNRTYSSQNQRHRYYNNGNHFYHANSEENEGRKRYRGRGGNGKHQEESRS